MRAVWCDASEDPAGALARLQRSGVEVAVALPPHLYYVREKTGAGEVLPAGFGFRGSPGAATDRTRALAPALPLPEPGESDLFFGASDALPPLPAAAAARIARAGAGSGLPFGARWGDTSEFMIGRVAVSILFPESDGTTDPNLYDWTPALRDSVVRSAVRGLAKWSSFAAVRGIPLTFAIEVHYGLATRYEPITRTVADEDTWIQDVLMHLRTIEEIQKKADLCLDDPTFAARVAANDEIKMAELTRLHAALLEKRGRPQSDEQKRRDRDHGSACEWRHRVQT